MGDSYGPPPHSTPLGLASVPHLADGAYIAMCVCVPMSHCAGPGRIHKLQCMRHPRRGGLQPCRSFTNNSLMRSKGTFGNSAAGLANGAWERPKILADRFSVAIWRLIWATGWRIAK